MNTAGYVLYGCGQLGVMALTRFFFQWVLTFAGQREAPGTTSTLFAATSVGALFFAFRVFDGLTDPIAGVLSDRWVAAGRQRRSLLWWSFALPALGLALVFTPTAEMSVSLRWTLLSLGMFTFFVGYTMYVIPYWSLIGDFSHNDATARAHLSNVLGVGALLATGLGFVVSPLLIDAYGYLAAVLVWCVPCAGLMLLPYFAQPRDLAAPRVSQHGDRTPSEGRAESLSLLQGFRLAFSHRSFVASIALLAGGQMSFTVMTAAAPFIATELLAGTTKDVAALLGPFLLSAILGFVAVPRLARRFGWERAIFAATLLLGVVYAGTGLLGSAAVGSPMVTAMVVFGLAGPMASVLLGLEGEAITSSAKEQPGEVTSVYFGVYNFVVKSLNGVALLLTGLLADAIPSHGSWAVRGMGFCAGGLLLGAVVLYWLLRPRGRAPDGTAKVPAQ